MPYNENIPQPNDYIRNSQNDILNNFISIKAAFDTNHVTFDLVDAGKHKFISFPVQGADPGGVLGEMQLYTKVSALSLVPELFIQDHIGNVVEFTSSQSAITGWTRLPSGILLKWGIGNANGSATINFPVSAFIPAFTAIYNIQLTNADAGAADSDSYIRNTGIVGVTGFTVYGSQRTAVAPQNVLFYYLAIGI